jgi:transcription antitermination protein NusB
MLNRRFLRIKVMQTLYAFFQHEKADRLSFEKELFKSLDKIHELYFYMLALLRDIHHTSLVIIDENKNKRIPSEEDLNPNLKFASNSLLKALSENEELTQAIAKRKISWQNDMDLVRKLYSDIRKGPAFKKYMTENETDKISEDKYFIIELITGFLSKNERLVSVFEDKNIHWADDVFVAFNSVIRNIEDFKGEFQLQPLLKDEEDDMDFMSALFSKTIIHSDEFSELINESTTNWELERIANMDILLMKMGLAEILYIPNIPVKATFNEYIEISKQYSSPGSKIFVNGVLDKIVRKLKAENKIQKAGRGLKES